MKDVFPLQIRDLEDRLQRHDEVSALNLKFRRSLRSRFIASQKTRAHKLVDIILGLICIFGCVYNEYQITSTYLDYEVIAESWFYSAESIIPPLFTFCAVLKNKNDSKMNFSTRSSDLFENTYSFAETFNQVGVHIQPKGIKPVKDVLTFERTHVTSYLYNQHLCHAINISLFEGNYINYTSSYLKSPAQPFMLYIKSNISLCVQDRTCEIFLNQYQSPHLTYLGTSVKTGEYAYIHYRKEELYLQPSPYVTRCRDYKGEGSISQEDCYDSCLKKEYFDKHHFVHMISHIIRGENITFGSFTDVDIKSFCDRSCKQIACELHSYSVVAVSAKYLPGESLILFNFPSSSKLKVNYLPRINFWDFVTLFGSVFGLWFGFSTFGVIDQFLFIIFQKSRVDGCG